MQDSKTEREVEIMNVDDMSTKQEEEKRDLDKEGEEMILKEKEEENQTEKQEEKRNKKEIENEKVIVEENSSDNLVEKQKDFIEENAEEMLKKEQSEMKKLFYNQEKFNESNAPESSIKKRKFVVQGESQEQEKIEHNHSEPKKKEAEKEDDRKKKRKLEISVEIQQILKKSCIEIEITEQSKNIDVINKEFFGLERIESKYNEIAKESYLKRESSNINKLYVKSKKKSLKKKPQLECETDKSNNEFEIKIERVLVALVISKKINYKLDSTDEMHQQKLQSFVVSDLNNTNMTIVLNTKLPFLQKIAPGLLIGIRNPQIIKSKPVIFSFLLFFVLFFFN